MFTVYNQKNTTLTVDGVPITGFMDGTSLTVTYDGGEVDKTQGTDGAGINIATPQGMTVQFTLRETSWSHDFLASLFTRQSNGASGVTVVLRTGANILHMLTDAYIGQPGQLTTGDKKQGGIQYTVTSANSTTSNLVGMAAGAVLGAAASAVL